MASPNSFWITLFLLSLMTCDSGVFGRAVHTLGFVSQSLKSVGESSTGSSLRTAAKGRWRRGAADSHREQCAELAAPWLENTKTFPEDNPTVLQLRIRPFSPGISQGTVFPEKHLFSFVRRVYRCCQERMSCRSVKGIQGRFRGDAHVEFVLSSDIPSLSVMGAELHLQLSNPQHLDIVPVISSMAKRNLPTRYRVWSRGDTVELKVDLLFLFRSLQEEETGTRGGPSLMNMRRVVFSPQVKGPGEKGALQDTDGDLWGGWCC